MATSEEKELTINRHLETLDDALENGPPDENSAQFLRDLANEARQLVSAIDALTPADVDEIWQEEDEEEGIPV